MACLQCGFELVEEGHSCRVCGAETITAAVAGSDVAPTVQQDASGADSPSPYGRRSRATLSPGTIFASEYIIDSLVGRGGMGTVYRVHERSTGATRALKLLHAAAADPDAVGRFKREISILSRLTNPAIPRIYRWGVEDETMYFLSDFVEGRNLRQIQRERGAFTIDETRQIGLTVARALASAHELGVVHRDVKPHNIMITPDRATKLLDFGIARGAGLELNAITSTGMIIGTPEYMSPEQFEGIRVDARSDIYSLGVVLYELLAGATPFVADTPVSLGIKHAHELPPPIRSHRAGVPAWLERVIFRCLAKQPSERFFSAAELVDELSRERGGERRTRRLPNGDQVVEDDSDTNAHALILSTATERPEWSLGMALHFEDRYYQLDDLRRSNDRWLYLFSYWPEERIFRKVVDYAADAAASEKRGLSSRLRGLFKP